jgi:sugar/nucleoside kinase (ribokinase family)
MAQILGMGNALVDLMTKIDQEEILEQLKLPKGSMQLVDADISKNVLDNTANYPKVMTSGGSAANTIHGLARLGADTAFIGTIGQDETGDFFHNDMKSSGIHPILFRSKTPSGVAIALVSPDGERTFATYLGAAVDLLAAHLESGHFAGYKYFYVEGYLVFNEELLLKALKEAKKAGLLIALDLASYNVVEAKKDFIMQILGEYVDIVFANEEEANALCGLAPEKAIDFLSDLCAIAVVKTGAAGALLKQDGKTIHVPAIKVTPLDTTGAGDMFAAGFLYAQLHGFTLKQAGQMGTLLAGNVIEVLGAKMNEERWAGIRAGIKTL